MKELAHVVVPHPIGGLNFQGVQQRATMAFTGVLEAAREWQPSGM